MDRNTREAEKLTVNGIVALRKESVDRNLTWHCITEDVSYVALRKESVDRNGEINTRGSKKVVALRKESVDRNYLIWRTLFSIEKSLSARRAWIEIITVYGYCLLTFCRSPQGERG